MLEDLLLCGARCSLYTKKHNCDVNNLCWVLRGLPRWWTREDRGRRGRPTSNAPHHCTSTGRVLPTHEAETVIDNAQQMTHDVERWSDAMSLPKPKRQVAQH